MTAEYRLDLALIHHPVVNRDGEVIEPTSVSNGESAAGGLALTPLEDWVEGSGDGLLLEPTGAQVSLDPGGSFMCGALCRTPSAAKAAVKAGAHFIVLSLPGEPTDEQRFAPVFQYLGVPAYLGWYDDYRGLDRARASWAHGCAVGPP